MLVGDFDQLPSVGDRPLFYADRGASPATKRPKRPAESGMSPLLAISESIPLDVVMRQDGQDEETERFKDNLSRLRSGTPTRADFDLLRTQLWAEL